LIGSAIGGASANRLISGDSNGVFETMMESPGALRFMTPAIGGGSERGSIVSKNKKKQKKGSKTGEAACCAPGTEGKGCIIM